MKKTIITILIALCATSAQAQLIVTSADSLLQCTPEWLVKHVLLESGVTVSNVKFNGSSEVIDCNSIGYFETGNSPTNLGIASGLILATGGVSVAVGPNNDEGKIVHTTCDQYIDETLEAISYAPDSVFDMSVLEFDFVPWDKEVSFNYVFASEEYLEWVGTFYNDVFGFFVTGINPEGGYYDNQNMALIPGTDETVSINSVYTQHNSQYFVNNAGGQTIQFDGFTTVLTVSFRVEPFTEYHIKLGICDVGDPDWDSGVFLEAHSFFSNLTYDMAIDEMPYQEIPENYRFCSHHDIEFNTITEWNFDDVTWYFGDGTSAHGAQVSHTYEEDGVYEVVNVLRNPHRATDSLFLTTTIVTESYATEIVETHCEKFDWNGQNYTESGVYEYLGQNIHGCDSLVVLNLTINHSYTSQLQGPQRVVASTEPYPYAVPDTLNLAPNTLFWSCTNLDWSIMPSDDGLRCDLWANNGGQGTLTARMGVECDSVFSLVITASGYDVEESKTQEISVFPNPACSQVTVEGQQISRIRLVDGFGQTVLDKLYESLDSVTLDLNGLPQGIYVMIVSGRDGEHTISTTRLVISPPISW